jgi:hypothetical protein
LPDNQDHDWKKPSESQSGGKDFVLGRIVLLR